MSNTRNEAEVVLQAHLNDATESLQKAINLAEAHDLSFDWEGPHDMLDFSYSKVGAVVNGRLQVKMKVAGHITTKELT